MSVLLVTIQVLAFLQPEGATILHLKRLATNFTEPFEYQAGNGNPLWHRSQIWLVSSRYIYRIAGNFEGENFWKFSSFVVICEMKFVSVASFGAAKASNPRKFSPSKVSRYTVTIFRVNPNTEFIGSTWAKFSNICIHLVFSSKTFEWCL